MIRYSIMVNGKVQGVGFRFFTSMQASQFNLTGWCKNLYNGKVNIEIQGDEKNFMQFITAIKKGNGFCRVDDIEMTSIPIDKNSTKYKIK